MKKMSLALAAAALVVGCGPSPEAVCEKTLALLTPAVGEASAKQTVGGDLKACVERETTRKDLQGMMKYKENNACLMEASSAAELTACSKKK